MQVLQDHAKEFIDQMNSKVIAHELKSLGIIPENIECDVLQSKNKEESNAHLFNHLKEDADEKAVREVFRIASDKTGYGKMNTFAGSVLRKLHKGLYLCTCHCCVPLHALHAFM